MRVRSTTRSIDLSAPYARFRRMAGRSEEHTSELQSQSNLVCRLLLEKKKTTVPAARFTDSASTARVLSSQRPRGVRTHPNQQCSTLPDYDSTVPSMFATAV